MYHIAMIDDDQMLRDRLSDQFARSNRVKCVLSVDTVEKFLKFHRDFLEIDLILLDINLYHQSGIHGLPLIRQREPDAEIVMYTIQDDYDTIFQAICNGATGYLLKHQSPEELEKEICRIMDEGGALVSPVIAKRMIGYFHKKTPAASTLESAEDSLTPKEQLIVTQLRDGLTYEEIASHLGMTINGTRYYVKNIYRKLHVRNRKDLLSKMPA